MSHTQGPWHVTDCRNQKRGQLRIFPEIIPGYQIANVMARNPNAEANAALIARAPDLLAENERLREKIRELEAFIDARRGV